ncbi:MAG: hypothetical protein Q7S33_00700 [Nanoarchaeota archaeon]|nr:hypothetical protein [Nanoarchaeota archaeon]
MYEIENYCLIDGSKMIIKSDDNSKRNYHCNLCGFEYWFYCTEEQARSGAKKYLKNFSDEKINEIAELIKQQTLSLPTNNDLEKRAKEFFIALKFDNDNKRKELEKNLENFNLGRESVLNEINARIITRTKIMAVKIT